MPRQLLLGQLLCADQYRCQLGSSHDWPYPLKSIHGDYLIDISIHYNLYLVLIIDSFSKV
jgi:hypothetical protein